MVKRILPLLGLLPLVLNSCGTGPSVNSNSVIVVKDVRIPSGEPLVARFARHTWVDYRENTSSPWRRIEIVSKSSGLIHKEIPQSEFEAKERWGQKVVVLSQSDGKGNPNYVRDIAQFAEKYDWSVYRAYPGPNSNTFAENLIRNVEGISAPLDHNAVGKEWGFYAGRTVGGSGVELQTPLIGAAVGLREGIQLSVIGLTGGFSIAPPSLKIPILPPIPRW